MAHDVFISYSTSDRHVANAVCARLESSGIRCWIAPRDILPGSGWGGAIVRAISDTRVMVLIFSSKANQSPQILREVERAVGRGVVIVPVRIEDVTPEEDLEYFLSSQHWLDVLTPPLEAHLDKLCDVVQRVLASSSEAAPAPERHATQPMTVAPPARRSRRAVWVAGAAAALVLAASAGAMMLRGGETVDDGRIAQELSQDVPGETIVPDPPGSPPAGQPDRASGDPPPPVMEETEDDPEPQRPETVTDAGEETDPVVADPPPDPPATAKPLTGLVVLVKGDARDAQRTETAILSAVLRSGAGLRAMDAATLQLMRSDASAIDRALAGDLGTLASLAREHAAKYIVLGDLAADAQPSVAGPFFTGTAQLDIALYEVATGALVRTETFALGSGGVPGKLGPNANAARTDAVSEVGNQAAVAVEKWVGDAGG